MDPNKAVSVSPYWTQAEVAAFLKCTPRNVRILQAKGLIRGYRIAGGRSIRYRASDVEALLKPIPNAGDVA